MWAGQFTAFRFAPRSLDMIIGLGIIFDFFHFQKRVLADFYLPASVFCLGKSFNTEGHMADMGRKESSVQSHVLSCRIRGGIPVALLHLVPPSRPDPVTLSQFQSSAHKSSRLPAPKYQRGEYSRRMPY